MAKQKRLERRGVQRGGSRGARLAAFRTWALFVCVFAVLLVLLWRLGGFFEQDVEIWTARATAWSLRVLGSEAQARGSFVDFEPRPIRIIFECTAVFSVAIYAAAVLAYPVRLRSKLLGLAAGVVLLVLVNQVRLVSLLYVGSRFPDVFEFSHHVVGQSLIVFFTLLLWLAWASRAGERRATGSP